MSTLMPPINSRYTSTSLIHLASYVAPLSPAVPNPVEQEKVKSLAPTKTITKEEFFPTMSLNIGENEPSRFVILPENTAKIIWDLLGICFIIYQAIMIPYEVGFNQPTTEWRSVLNNVVQGFFVLDLVLNFNTAFYLKGNIVINRKLIAKQYVHSWLFLDVVTVLPYDYIVAGITNSSDSSGMVVYQAPQMARILKMVSFIRFLRLIRLMKLKTLILAIEDYISSQSIATLVMVLKLLVTAFFVAHWTACMWYMVSYLETADHPSTWISTRGLQYPSQAVEAYVASLYWAVTTIMTIGYGDIHAITNNEMICAIFAMGLGSGVFAYIVGKLGGIVNKRNERASQHREKVISLNSFMKQKDLPSDVRFRVRRYLDYVWERQASSKMEEDAIMNLLSEPLKEQIYTHTRGPVFKTYSIFENFDQLFLAALSKLLKQDVFAPGNDILEEGEKSTSLYFILSGTVDIWHKASKSSLKELNKDAYFGEIGFFAKIPRQASARCLTFTNMFVLARDPVDELLKQKPEAKEMFNLLEEKTRGGDFSSLKVVCYLCKNLGHVACGCNKTILQTVKDQFKTNWIQRRNLRTVIVNPDFANPTFARKEKRFRRDIHYTHECIIGVPRDSAKSARHHDRLQPKILRFKEEVEERPSSAEASPKPVDEKITKRPRLDFIIETEPDPLIAYEEIRKPEFDVSLIPSGKKVERQNATWTQGAFTEPREDGESDVESDMLNTMK